MDDGKGDAIALWRLTRLIRSKNAGAFEITIDIMFADSAYFDSVSRFLTRERFASLYTSLSPGDIEIYLHEEALAMKVTIPRPSGSSGSADDSDIFGAQFHSPLVELAVPTTDSTKPRSTNSPISWELTGDVVQ